MSIASLLGFVAAGIGMSCSLPQVLVLLRSSHADGVSFSSSVLAVLSSVTWLLYGLMLLDPAQLVSNIPGLAGAVIVMALVARRRSLPAGPAAAACATWVAFIAALAVFSGAAAVGLAATAVCVVSRGPQVVQALSGVSLAAVSPGSFALSIASSALWVVYGLAEHQFPVWGCSLVMGALSAIVLVRRCPPRRVVGELSRGRWGTPGVWLAAPVVAAYGALTRRTAVLTAAE